MALHGAKQDLASKKTFEAEQHARAHALGIADRVHFLGFRDDIPALVEHFCQNSQVAPRRGTQVSPEAMEVLQRYAWPGNVRELENVIERALILCDDGVVRPEHLPMGIRMAPAFEPEPGGSEWPTLEALEMRYIRRVLEHCKGHRLNAARMLGISERNLYRKLKELEQASTSES